MTGSRHGMGQISYCEDSGPLVRVWFVLTCSMTLAGCFGYEKPGKDWTFTCNNPGIELQSRGHIFSECQRMSAPTLKKDDVLQKWGPPNKKYAVRGLEHWQYSDASRWSGAVLYFIVPIPLPVPKLEYRTDLTFTGEDLTFIQVRRGTRTGKVCGLLPMPEYVPFFPSCSSFDGFKYPPDGWVVQDRSDTRVFPPGSRMVVEGDHYVFKPAEILNDRQRCATAAVLPKEQLNIDMTLGPAVAARTAERDAWNKEHDRDPWMRKPPWPERVINVYFHVITSGDGRSGRLKTADIEGLIAALNFSFSGTDFQFKVIETDYTSNDGWFHMTPGSPEERAAKTALREGKSEDLNIYTAEPKGGLRGWATFPWPYQEDPGNDGVVVLFTLTHAHPKERWGGAIAHQIGHWVGLYHTFQGGCEVPGDWVDDTGPQKFPTYGCLSKRHSCGEAYEPVHNPMNFSDDECIWGFTPQQGDRISAAFDAYRDGK